jgi:hypothetical protein
LGHIQVVVVVGAERLLIRLEEASSTSTSSSVVNEDVRLRSLTNSNSPKKDASILRWCNGSDVRD